MSVEASLLTGTAALLQDAGVSTWSSDAPTGGTGPVTTAVALPPAPDRAVAITVYALQDDPHHADALYGVQLRVRGTRGDVRSTWDTAAAIREALHGVAGIDLGGVPVIECHRQSSALLGEDDNGRWEQSDTYHMQVNAPTAYRPF